MHIYPDICRTGRSTGRVAKCTRRGTRVKECTRVQNRANEGQREGRGSGARRRGGEGVRIGMKVVNWYDQEAERRTASSFRLGHGRAQRQHRRSLEEPLQLLQLSFCCPNYPCCRPACFRWFPGKTAKSAPLLVSLLLRRCCGIDCLLGRLPFDVNLLGQYGTTPRVAAP